MSMSPFRLSRNAFPPHCKDISNTNLPTELLPKYTTIEYTLSRPAQVPPIFLFIVDTCLDADTDDLKALRDAIVVSLCLIPPYALVGLITYDTMTQVHGYAECTKSYVFRGRKEYQPKQIQDTMLGLSGTYRAAPRPGQPMPQTFSAARATMRVPAYGNP